MKRVILNKIAVLTAVFVTAAASADAQKATATAGADVVTSYMWRGQDLGGISVQPTASLSVGGFFLTAWGSVGFESQDTKEFDFSIGYSTGNLSFLIADLWFNTLDDSWRENNYFNYDARTTAHVFEAGVGYDFSVASLYVGTTFAGADYNEQGKRSYSTYIEAGAPFKLGGLDMKAELGLTPYKGCYADKFNIVNLGLTVKKEIKASDSFTLPVFTKIVFNPYERLCRFVFGITI